MDVMTVALAGNPNVGKSTLFNTLTGMRQHTGNWAGKTVSAAEGSFSFEGQTVKLVDLPGTYSLLTRSAEEEAARDHICFGRPDRTVIVCDASCLERNLCLAVQILEITDRAIVCVNLMDEAERRGIRLDLALLEKRLGVPVIGTVGRKRESLLPLLTALKEDAPPRPTLQVKYPEPLRTEALRLAERVRSRRLSGFWLAMRLLENAPLPEEALVSILGGEEYAALTAEAEAARRRLSEAGLDSETVGDLAASCVVQTAAALCSGAVSTPQRAGGRRLDRLLTGRALAYPTMAVLLFFILWLTVRGANAPSSALMRLFSALEAPLGRVLSFAPSWLRGALLDGVYRVLTWVVSVMLPPMAVFFPLFTLLEDVGYLPRVAFCLDRPLCRCRACGKQALTMCMGLGCNAVGVTGCRIIDSPRERLLAVLTNSFIPCNGRFPGFICVCSMFLVCGLGSFGAAVSLTAVIVLSVMMTFASTRLLSVTLLRGEPSAFTLELPPFRVPQVGKVIVRSVFDRTLFVLGRAAAVAAPAGLVLWAAANITPGGTSLLARVSRFLDPAARLMGLDGVILTAFVLAFPANETVIPIMVMAYLSGGTIGALPDMVELRALLIANGWGIRRAVCFVLFSLMHWPCSTTLLTVKKEAGSIKWTLAAFLLPTIFGFLCCAGANLLFTLANF